MPTTPRDHLAVHPGCLDRETIGSPKKCHGFETAQGDTVVRQPKKTQVKQDRHVTRFETLQAL